MFDLGFAELLVIGITALIVVGPKDLPVLFRNVGRFVGRMRGMARDFSRAMNDAADTTGLKDVQSTLKTAANPMGSAMDGVKKAATSAFDPDSETGKLSAEREEARKKIEASAARAQAERKQREASDALSRAEELEKSLAEDAAKASEADPAGADKGSEA